MNHADSGDIETLVQFSGSPILKILLNFWNCVGVTHVRGYFILNITEYVNLITVVIVIYKIWFCLNPRNFNPRNLQFRSVFHSKPYLHHRPPRRHSYQQMQNFQKWIFPNVFPGNWFKFGIILNDFWSSIIWVIQIQVLLTELKNPKNPGIQPSYDGLMIDFLKNRFNVMLHPTR